MNFIKLQMITNVSSWEHSKELRYSEVQDIFINSEKIIYIYANSALLFVDGSTIEVKESPEEILRLIKKQTLEEQYKEAGYDILKGEDGIVAAIKIEK